MFIANLREDIWRCNDAGYKPFGENKEHAFSGGDKGRTKWEHHSSKSFYSDQNKTLDRHKYGKRSQELIQLAHNVGLVTSE